MIRNTRNGKGKRIIAIGLAAMVATTSAPSVFADGSGVATEAPAKAPGGPGGPAGPEKPDPGKPGPDKPGPEEKEGELTIEQREQIDGLVIDANKQAENAKDYTGTVDDTKTKNKREESGKVGNDAQDSLDKSIDAKIAGEAADTYIKQANEVTDYINRMSDESIKKPGPNGEKQLIKAEETVKDAEAKEKKIEEDVTTANKSAGDAEDAKQDVMERLENAGVALRDVNEKAGEVYPSIGVAEEDLDAADTAKKTADTNYEEQLADIQSRLEASIDTNAETVGSNDLEDKVATAEQASIDAKKVADDQYAIGQAALKDAKAAADSAESNQTTYTKEQIGNIAKTAKDAADKAQVAADLAGDAVDLAKANEKSAEEERDKYKKAFEDSQAELDAALTQYKNEISTANVALEKANISRKSVRDAMEATNNAIDIFQKVVDGRASLEGETTEALVEKMNQAITNANAKIQAALKELDALESTDEKNSEIAYAKKTLKNVSILINGNGSNVKGQAAKLADAEAAYNKAIEVTGTAKSNASNAADLAKKLSDALADDGEMGKAFAAWAKKADADIADIKAIILTGKDLNTLNLDKQSADAYVEKEAGIIRGMDGEENRSIDKIVSDYDTAVANKEALDKSVSDLNDEITKKSGELDTKTQNKTTAEGEASSLQTSISEKEQIITDGEKKLPSLKKAMDADAKTLRDAQDRVTQLTKDIQEYDEKINAYGDQQKEKYDDSVTNLKKKYVYDEESKSFVLDDGEFILNEDYKKKLELSEGKITKYLDGDNELTDISKSDVTDSKGNLYVKDDNTKTSKISGEAVENAKPDGDEKKTCTYTKDPKTGKSGYYVIISQKYTGEVMKEVNDGSISFAYQKEKTELTSPPSQSKQIELRRKIVIDRVKEWTGDQSITANQVTFADDTSNDSYVTILKEDGTTSKFTYVFKSWNSAKTKNKDTYEIQYHISLVKKSNELTKVSYTVIDTYKATRYVKKVIKVPDADVQAAKTWLSETDTEAVYGATIYNLKKDADQNAAWKEKATEELNTVNSLIGGENGYQAKADSTKKAYDDEVKELADAKAALEDQTDENGNVVSKGLKSQLKDKNDLIASLTKDIDELTKALKGDANNNVKGLETQASEAKAAADANQAFIDKFQAAIEQYRSLLDKQKIANENLQKGQGDPDLNNLRPDVKRKYEDALRAAEDIKKLIEKAKQYSQEATKQASELQKYIDAENKVKDTVDKAKQAINDANTKVADLKKQLESVEANVEITRDRLTGEVSDVVVVGQNNKVSLNAANEVLNKIIEKISKYTDEDLSKYANLDAYTMDADGLSKKLNDFLAASDKLLKDQDSKLVEAKKARQEAEKKLADLQKLADNAQAEADRAAGIYNNYKEPAPNNGFGGTGPAPSVTPGGGGNGPAPSVTPGGGDNGPATTVTPGGGSSSNQTTSGGRVRITSNTTPLAGNDTQEVKDTKKDKDKTKVKDADKKVDKKADDKDTAKDADKKETKEIKAAETPLASTSKDESSKTGPLAIIAAAIAAAGIGLGIVFGAKKKKKDEDEV